MGCAASTGPLYRDEHDFATTAAYYDTDDDVKKDWVENEQLGEGMFARVVKISTVRKTTSASGRPGGIIYYCGHLDAARECLTSSHEAS